MPCRGVEHFVILVLFLSLRGCVAPLCGSKPPEYVCDAHSCDPLVRYRDFGLYVVVYVMCIDVTCSKVIQCVPMVRCGGTFSMLLIWVHPWGGTQALYIAHIGLERPRYLLRHVTCTPQSYGQWCSTFCSSSADHKRLRACFWPCRCMTVEFSAAVSLHAGHRPCLGTTGVSVAVWADGLSFAHL